MSQRIDEYWEARKISDAQIAAASSDDERLAIVLEHNHPFLDERGRKYHNIHLGPEVLAKIVDALRFKAKHQNE